MEQIKERLEEYGVIKPGEHTTIRDIDLAARYLRELGKEVNITAINTVLGALILVDGFPFNRTEEGGEVFVCYQDAWVDGVWCKDLRINVRHVVMTRKLI